MELTDQVAIVTGAAVRIGRSIAISLAEAGCDVLIHYGASASDAESCAEEVRDLGRRAATVTADLAAPQAAAETILAACHEELGSPSILVNSAAIFEQGTLQDSSADQWERHLAINLSAPFQLMQQFAKNVEATLVDGSSTESNASIVNIVDWRATVHPRGHLAYTVSKSGLLTLTRLAAQDLAPKIRVNAIAPGPMLPPPGEDESYLEPVIAKLPIGRAGTPNDIADAVVWLAKSDFVTGAMLNVDGGQQFSGGMA